MHPKASDDFLISLAQSISAMQATVDGIETHLEKLDEKVVDPFSEWVHSVKLLRTEVKSMEDNLKSLEKLVTDNATKSSDTFKEHADATKGLTDKISKFQWYVSGIVGTITLLVTIIYSIFNVLKK